MTESNQTETGGLLAAWRWWLPPALLAMILALVFVDPFAGDWDALDYTVLAINGEPSSMILGRMLFIFTNHALWCLAHTLFGLPPEHAYLLFQYAVVAESPLAVIAWWQLARDLTGSLRAATIAALLLSLSPFYIIYSGQAMTEIPSLLLLAVALIVHLRGLRSRRIWMVLLGAALLGLGVNVREGVALYAPWLLFAPLACGWGLRRREITTTLIACLIFIFCAFGPFALWWLMDIDHYRKSWHGWVELTRQESARHPVRLVNMGRLLHFFFITAPLALVAFPVAAFKEWRERGLSPLFLLGLIGLLANLSLIVHYSVVLNGRYLLTGAPAMAPLAADYFLRAETAKRKHAGRAFVAVLSSIFFIAGIFALYSWPVGSEYVRQRALAKDYGAQLALVPSDAVMISGSQTVAVTYWRGIGAGRWEVIGSGGAWPGEQLPHVIENYLREGRRVFIDADPRWWADTGWQLSETRMLLQIEPLFRFRRVSDTIYEIRPLDDETARDQPNLQRLLPIK
ncbi:MAG TPA: glycosyltransferase family 39 protein [Pyrinomonadaceae bacterium]|jgi:4-amino-4-deoxy-L-arabinose transferase-like glycosyltransferase